MPHLTYSTAAMPPVSLKFDYKANKLAKLTKMSGLLRAWTVLWYHFSTSSWQHKQLLPYPLTCLASVGLLVALLFPDCHPVPFRQSQERLKGYPVQVTTDSTSQKKNSFIDRFPMAIPTISDQSDMVMNRTDFKRSKTWGHSCQTAREARAWKARQN